MAVALRVHLTFDVEVWCPGWQRLDDTFPAAFERYVWGRSAEGEYGLPRNLQILQRYGLKAVFFVEPLFGLRFGTRYLATIVDLIQAAGQEVQLHLHPEWVDEISPPLLGDVSRKRQHLTDYSLEEQTALLCRAKRVLQEVAGKPITGFRSGGYAANRLTYQALAKVGITADSSVNATYDHSAGSLGDFQQLRRFQRIEGVAVHPVTVFRDGRGHWRHLQVGACGFREMRQVLDQAHAAGLQDVVLVSHNFELLKPGGTQPDRIVERRFDRLCAYLAAHRDRFQVGGFEIDDPDSAARATNAAASSAPPLRSDWLATGLRVSAQALRRLV